MRDQRELLVFAQGIVERGDRDRLRREPVGRRELQRRGRELELLVVEGERHHHVIGRRLGQLDRVAVGDASCRITFQNQRAVVVGVLADLGEQDASRVVVDHGHEHVAHLRAAVGGDRSGLRCGLRGTCRRWRSDGRLHAVADRDDALAFLLVVVGRCDEHGLACAPVAAVEHQHDGAVANRRRRAIDQRAAIEVGAVGRDQHRVTATGSLLLFLWRTRSTDRHVDQGAGSHRRGQPHRVAVERAPVAGGCFAHQRRTAAFGDDDVPAGRTAATAPGQAGGIEVDAADGQAVVAGVDARNRFVIDVGALAFEFLGRDDIGHVGANVEDVVAQATDDLGRHAERRALDREVVVALHAVDFEHLDVGEGDVDAATEYALVGDDEVVAELGAEDQHLVEAGAAIDGHGRVQRVLDEVVAGAALDHLFTDGRKATLGARNAIAVEHQRAVERVGLGKRERAHDEQVVAVAAFEAQRRLVAVNLERVVSAAALGHDGRTVAAAQVAARRRHGAKHVTGQQVGAGIALRTELLADLEEVVASATVQRGDDAVVVRREVVVAATAFDDQPAIEVGVVVDALDLRQQRRDVLLRPQRAVQQRHEGLGGIVRRTHHAAQQEDVVAAVGAKDLQFVNPLVLGAAVDHVDQVVAGIALAAQRVDLVVVGAGLAVERERVFGHHGGGRGRGDCRGALQVIHPHQVFTVRQQRLGVLAAMHGRLGAQEDVAGRAPGGGARHATGVAEVEGVAVGVAPDVDLAVAHRRQQGRCPAAHRLGAGRVAQRHDRVGHDLAAQRDRRAPTGVGIRVVAENVDRRVGHDRAVAVGRHVIAHAQRHAALFGKDQAVRHVARRIALAARQPRVALGEARAARREQVEVLVMIVRLAHR